MSENVLPLAPAKWERTTLGELCARGGGDVQTGPFGSQLHAADYVQKGIPSVMPVNLGNNRILDTGVARISSEDAQRLARHQLQQGDIVYSRRGDVERRALVREHESGWLCGTGCLRVRPGTAVNSEWLSYYLGHPAVRSWIVRHAVGATMPNLNTGVLSSLPVVIPLPLEQKAIAWVLGALEVAIDCSARIQRLCWTLASAFYERAVSGATETTPLSKVVDLVYGKGLPANVRNAGRVPVYGSGGIVGWHDVALVEGPGVVVGRKGTVGAVHWSDSPFFPIDTTFYARALGGIPMLYAYFCLRGLQLDRMNFDSAVPGLNRQAALVRRVQVPSAKGLESFVAAATPLVERAEAARNEQSILGQLRDALLPPLVGGELEAAGTDGRLMEDV